MTVLHVSAPLQALPTEARRLKVVAVTQSDPFFTGRFFETFLATLAGGPVELLEIIVLPNFNESKPALALRLLKLYGAVDLVRLLWRYARARWSDRFGAPRSVEALASRYGVPVRALRTINDESYLRTLRERRIDVLLSVAAPEIFRRAALRAAPHVLNIHTGKLPYYRGMMPTFWALHNGERHVVTTVHEMAERLDAGGVLAEWPVAIEATDSVFALAARCKTVAGREVARVLARLATAAWPTSRPPETAGQSYYRFPTRRDALRVRAMGKRLL
jgi:methionyl-tRNA formyltransferase